MTRGSCTGRDSHNRIGSAPAPSVSVLIPTYRDAHLLRKSLPLLLHHPRDALEVLVLNNDRSQDIRSLIGQNADDPRVRIVEIGFDSGFVRAVNRGVGESTGELVMLCNADLFPSETYVTEMLRFFDEHQNAGAAIGKLLRYDLAADRPTDVIDSAGLVLTRQRRLLARGEGDRDVGQFDESVEVFAVDGAAPVVRRSALEEISVDGEYLDEDFVSHKVDHDMCWQLRLAGWECWYHPNAIAYHGRSTRGLGSTRYFSDIRGFHQNEQEKSHLVRTHAMKNQWLLLLKNEDRSNFIRDFPFILGREAMVVTHNLLFAPRTLAAIPMTLKVLGGTLRKRRAMKARQRMDPLALRRWIDADRKDVLGTGKKSGTKTRPELASLAPNRPDLRALTSVLRCPNCASGVGVTPHEVVCSKCSASFEIVDGIPVLLRSESALDEHKAQQVSFWDMADEEWEIERPTGAPRLYRWMLDQKFARSVSGLGSMLPGATVLTVCGGSGMEAEFLAAHAATVITADISLESAKRAQARGHRHNVDLISIVADAEALPFANRTVDVVYVHDGLHHLEEPDRGLAEILRVARLAVSINEPADAVATRVAMKVGLSEKVEEAGNQVARMNVREILSRLENEGFQPIVVSRFAIVYRHVPGRLSRLLSHQPMFSVLRSFYGVFNLVAGGVGNKLTVQAVRRNESSQRVSQS